IGVVERGHDTRVVEERIRVASLGREFELVTDVILRVADVVDVDVVRRLVVEAVEVGTGGRLEQRHPAAYECHPLRRVRRHPGPQVRVVGQAVLGCAWRFAVARRPGRTRSGEERDRGPGAQSRIESAFHRKNLLRSGTESGWETGSAGAFRDTCNTESSQGRMSALEPGASGSYARAPK